MLATFDGGFGNIQDYPVGTHAGVVVFRLQGQRWAVLEAAARRMLQARVLEHLHGGLAVVDESRIRLRAGVKRKESS